MHTAFTNERAQVPTPRYERSWIGNNIQLPFDMQEAIGAGIKRASLVSRGGAVCYAVCYLLCDSVALRGTDQEQRVEL
jgi:hypothetical protein